MRGTEKIVDSVLWPDLGPKPKICCNPIGIARQGGSSKSHRKCSRIGIEPDATKVSEFQVMYNVMKLDFLSRDTCRDFKKPSFQVRLLTILCTFISLPRNTCHDFNTGCVTVSRKSRVKLLTMFWNLVSASQRVSRFQHGVSRFQEVLFDLSH